METQQPKQATGVIVAGYSFALLCLFLLPVIFMPIGIICGLICIAYKRIGNGIVIILLSIILGCFGASIGGWGLGLPKFKLDLASENSSPLDDDGHTQFVIYFKDQNRSPEKAFDIDDPWNLKVRDSVRYQKFGSFQDYYVLKSDVDSIVKVGSFKDGLIRGAHIKLN